MLRSGDVLLLNSTGEPVVVSLLYGDISSHSVETLGVSLGLCRSSSREDGSIVVKPLQLRFRVPAFGLTPQDQPTTISSFNREDWQRSRACKD